MFKKNSFKKAVAIVLALFVLFSVIVVVNILLIFFSSQLRLSHHQVARIQAYYAGMAGINYALEQLRTGSWTEGIHYLSDSEFPWPPIKNRRVQIEIGPMNATTGQRRVRVRVTYISKPY